MDSGVESKSKLMENLSQQPSIRKTFIYPHHPQANGKLKSTQIDQKLYSEISVDGVLEWDQLLPDATTAFNWFLNEHSKESPHFLHFGCIPDLPHSAAFLQP